MKPEASGAMKWATIGLTVVALDLLVPGETLTSAFRRAREHEHPLVRVAALGGLAITAAHLMDRLGPVDPFNLTIEQWNKHNAR